MATQRWTICKIGGAAADAVLAKCQSWHERSLIINARDGEDRGRWEESELADISRFVEVIRTHAAELPLLYFSEHIDMWNIGGGAFTLLKNVPGICEIENAGYDMACLPIRPGQDFTPFIREIPTRNPLSQELTWFSSNVLNAIWAWEQFIRCGLIVVIRESLGPGPTDDEVVAGCGQLPAWLYKEAISEASND